MKKIQKLGSVLLVATTSLAWAEEPKQDVLLHVDRMMCGSCTSRVKKSISSHPGVSEVTVNLTDQEARFACPRDKGCNREKILKDLSKIGYPSKIIEEKK